MVWSLVSLMVSLTNEQGVILQFCMFLAWLSSDSVDCLLYFCLAVSEPSPKGALSTAQYLVAGTCWIHQGFSEVVCIVFFIPWPG